MKLDNVRWSNIRPLGGWEIIEKRRWLETIVKTQGRTLITTWDGERAGNVVSENASLQRHIVVRELMRRK